MQQPDSTCINTKLPLFTVAKSATKLPNNQTVTQSQGMGATSSSGIARIFNQKNKN